MQVAASTSSFQGSLMAALFLCLSNCITTNIYRKSIKIY